MFTYKHIIIIFFYFFILLNLLNKHILFAFYFKLIEPENHVWFVRTSSCISLVAALISAVPVPYETPGITVNCGFH